jgi:transcription antitermination factor NusG
VPSSNWFKGLIIAAVFVLAGCGHKLVAHSGDTTVPLYPDKATFDKVKTLQNQGGAAGMFGGIGQQLMAKKIDDQTPVKVISSDDEGDEVQITGGPMQGTVGYVAKDSVD